MATPNHLSTSQFNYFNSFTYWSSIVGLCLKRSFIYKKRKSFHTTESFPDTC